MNSTSKKLFDFGVELSRSIRRDGTIYGQETVEEASAVPSEVAYTGPLDSEGRIPAPIDQETIEAAEDKSMGGYGRNRKELFRDLCEDYSDE